MKKAQYWASSFSTLCVYNSNGFQDQQSAFQLRIAAGKKESVESEGSNSLSTVQEFINQHPGQFIAGFIGYDFSTFFFIPEILLSFNDTEVEIVSDEDPKIIIDAILAYQPVEQGSEFSGKIQARLSREEYGQAFRKVQAHIQRGDIYEMNLCQEFYAENAQVSPFSLYQQLNKCSPNPFSCFFKHEDQYILSASPERFLAKRGAKLFSQPIKGTAPRGRTPEEDQVNSEHLRNNPKDISENVMIVDLVRNDLTRIAAKGSVQVDELLGLYSFPHVHQLISSVSCQLPDTTPFSEVITHTFPPGSMTGAPKIKAMQLIEEIEKSNRGIYSGSIGYLAPSGDFDFNVVIRSIVYDQKRKYLSYHVGGAITALSSEEEEYQECLLKAGAIIKTLS